MDKNRFCISKKFIIIIFLITSILLLIMISLSSFKKPTIIKTKAATKTTSNQSHLAAEIFNKKVLLIIYDPYIDIEKTKKLSTWLKYNNKSFHDPLITTKGIIDSFKESTIKRLNYSIVKKITIDTFPKKKDNVQFEFETLTKCLTCSSSSSGFNSVCDVGVDYPKIIDEQQICEQANNNIIDEVWFWGYSWFGFNESALIGPSPFAYNGYVSSNVKCNKLVPMMGFNYERTLSEALHDFGHRAEATMTKVYNNWSENRINTRWDKFGLTKAQSPDYSFGGCGSTHFTPISGEGIYDDRSEGDSICNQFSNYDLFNSPNILSDNTAYKEKINCNISPWKCTQSGYLTWWFSKLPKFTGIGFDGALNDWVAYIAEPQRANDFPATVETTCNNYTQFGIGAGPKECLNKTYNNNNCNWYEYCQQCANSDTKLGGTCNSFCNQFDNNITGCIKAQNLGYGCAWHSGLNKCIKENSDQNIISTMLPVTKSTAQNYFDIYITLNEPSSIYINKEIDIEIYEVLSDGAVGRKLATEVITNKAYKEVPYRLYLDQIDSVALKPGKKYYIKPLLITNEKNPVSYTVTTNDCPIERVSFVPKCIFSPSKIINFNINMSNVSCYNISDVRFCNIPQCAWSNKNICYKIEDQIIPDDPNDPINLRNYCRNIKESNICRLNDICLWNNKCENKITISITPTNIVVSHPTPTPTPIPIINKGCIF